MERSPPRDRTELLQSFVAWITHVLLPRNDSLGRENDFPSLEELRAMLQERTYRTWSEIAYEEGEKKGLVTGLQEGRQEGRLQGRIELLEEQLEAKFGPLDDPVRHRLHAASSSELLHWGTRFATAETLEDVFD